MRTEKQAVIKLKKQGMISSAIGLKLEIPLDRVRQYCAEEGMVGRSNYTKQGTGWDVKLANEWARRGL